MELSIFLPRAIFMYFDRSHNVLKKRRIDMLDKLGGLGGLIKPGDTVGLKINLTGGDGAAQTWKQSGGVSAIDSFWMHPLVPRHSGHQFGDNYLREAENIGLGVNDPGKIEVIEV